MRLYLIKKKFDKTNSEARNYRGEVTYKVIYKKENKKQNNFFIKNLKHAQNTCPQTDLFLKGLESHNNLAWEKLQIRQWLKKIEKE